MSSTKQLNDTGGSGEPLSEYNSDATNIDDDEDLHKMLYNRGEHLRAEGCVNLNVKLKNQTQ